MGLDLMKYRVLDPTVDDITHGAVKKKTLFLPVAEDHDSKNLSFQEMFAKFDAFTVSSSEKLINWKETFARKKKREEEYDLLFISNRYVFVKNAGRRSRITFKQSEIVTGDFPSRS